MPGAIIGRHELQQRTIALDHEMRRDPQRAQLIEIRMGITIERIAKQVGNIRPAKLARRQADVMNNQQFGWAIGGTRIAIGRA